MSEYFKVLHQDTRLINEYIPPSYSHKYVFMKTWGAGLNFRILGFSELLCRTWWHVGSQSMQLLCRTWWLPVPDNGPPSGFSCPLVPCHPAGTPACRHLASLPKFCPYYLANSWTYSGNMVHTLENGATGDPCLGLGNTWARSYRVSSIWTVTRKERHGPYVSPFPWACEKGHDRMR